MKTWSQEMENLTLQRGEENLRNDTLGWQVVQTIWLSLDEENPEIGSLGQPPLGLGSLSDFLWYYFFSFAFPWQK